MDPIRATPLQGDREVAYRNIFFRVMGFADGARFLFLWVENPFLSRSLIWAAFVVLFPKKIAFVISFTEPTTILTSEPIAAVWLF